MGFQLGVYSRSLWLREEGLWSLDSFLFSSGLVLAKGLGLRGRFAQLEWGLGLPRVGKTVEVSELTHFWNTKMPTMRVKEIRSAVTHMRQYSSGGCRQMARGQLPVMAHSR